MSAVLGLLLAFPGVLVAGLGVYLVTLAVAGAAGPRRETPQRTIPGRRLAVVVPAHNEAGLIERCVRSLLAQSYPAHLYRVVVVADNCTDETADKARAAGAEVLLRDVPAVRGKGHALRLAMDTLLAEPNPPDAIVIVDADSIADSELLTALAASLDDGHPVVQADYELLSGTESGGSELVRAGFLLFHRVRFSGRARLGMAANLVGNGMLFSRHVLETHPWDAFTAVEDLEYSIRLRLAGIRPFFARAARVAGPGPASRAGAARQRLRWEGGRFYVLRTHLLGLSHAAIARRDLSLLDEALDLAVPPLGLLGLAAGVGTLISAAAVSTGVAPLWALAPWVIAMLSIPMFVSIGLWSAGETELAWHVMRRGPAYLGWKILTYVRILRGFDPHRWDRTDRAGEPAAAQAQRVDIAGVPVDAVDMPTALRHMTSAIGGPNLYQVSTINLDFMVRAQIDPAVREIFRRSDLNLPDGAPVVWLGRLLGASVPGRVAGADFVPALLGEAAKVGARVFLLGGEDGVAEMAAERLVQLHPGLEIAGFLEPPRSTAEGMNNTEILARIKEARADVLLVAFGHPKQEVWIDMHRDQLAVSVAIGVGCVLDLIAGRSRRAPLWMQQLGLEWAYRLSREPRRLMGRYVRDAAWLLPITARTLRSRLGQGAVAKAA